MNSNPPTPNDLKRSLLTGQNIKKEHKFNQFQQQIHQTPKQKAISLTSETQSHVVIYDIPDLTHVSRGVLCKLLSVSLVCIIFLAVEITGGLLASSLAILSDAAHLFSDLSGFFISIFSIWLGQQPASNLMSFGYHRAEVIGALGSIILIWGLTVLLIFEATDRIIKKTIVTDPLIMVITACFGLFCNLVMAKILHAAPQDSHTHGTNIFHHCSHEHLQIHGDHNEKEQKFTSPVKQKKYKKTKVSLQKHEITTEEGKKVLIVEQQLINSDSPSPIYEENQEENTNSVKQSINLGHVHSEACQHISSQSNVEDQLIISASQNKIMKIQPKNILGQKNAFSKSELIPYDTQELDQNKILEVEESCSLKMDPTYNQITNQNDQGYNNEFHVQQRIEKKNSEIHDHAHEIQQITTNNKNLTQVSESDNFNLRAATIHVLGDIIQSLGVLIAAILIYFLTEKDFQEQIIYNKWQLADPICTYIFSIIVLFTTYSVAKECLKVLMEGTPSGMVSHEFEAKLSSIPRVKEVHDLHIWSLSVGKPAMSAHIVCVENQEYVLKKATKLCRQFGIYHSTIQIEQADRQGQKDYIKCDHNLHQ